MGGTEGVTTDFPSGPRLFAGLHYLSTGDVGNTGLLRFCKKERLPVCLTRKEVAGSCYEPAADGEVLGEGC